jgi:hypothetical protein
MNEHIGNYSQPPWCHLDRIAFRLLLVRVAAEKALPFEPLNPNAETVAAISCWTLLRNIAARVTIEHGKPEGPLKILAGM